MGYTLFIDKTGQGEKLYMSKKFEKKVTSIIAGTVFVLGLGFTFLHENYDIEVVDNIGEMVGFEKSPKESNKVSETLVTDNLRVASSDIPEYTGIKNIILNNNESELSEDEFYVSDTFYLSNLDEFNRVGFSKALLTPETYRGSSDRKENSNISNIKPTGWKQKKVNNSYLYNRSHLIGYAMTTEGDVDSIPNLMTGTRDFNADSEWGMWAYEYKVQEAVKSGKTVYYEVNPVFEGNNLVADGVQMRAWATDDSLDFNVFIYNVQDGVTINYLDGTSKLTK